MTREVSPGFAGSMNYFEIQKRRHDFAGLLARHDRHDLEGHAEPLAVQHPFLQQPRIVAFHQLEAAVEIRLDPAPDIFQPLGKFYALSRTRL